MQNENRTLEQIYRSAVSGLYARLRSNYDFLYDRFGDEGIELIRDMSHHYGLDIVERARKSLDNTEPLSVVKYLMRIFETVTMGKNIIHLDDSNPSCLIIRAEDCPLHFTQPAMCLAHTTMEKTVVEELNPDLTYRIGKSIPAGDKYCEHIIEIKNMQE